MKPIIGSLALTLFLSLGYAAPAGEGASTDDRLQEFVDTMLESVGATKSKCAAKETANANRVQALLACARFDEQDAFWKELESAVDQLGEKWDAAPLFRLSESTMTLTVGEQYLAVLFDAGDGTIRVSSTKEREHTFEEVEGEILLAGLEGVSNPTVVRASRVAPRFPDEARAAGVNADVLMQAIIDATGTPQTLTVLIDTRPGYGFSEAALEAVRNWRYEPALFDGRPVPVYFTVLVGFHLQ